MSLEFARNKAITDMRHEIAKGADWLLNLNWCLKLTADPEDPVAACHMPLGVECNGATTGFDAIYAHDSTTLFPLSWRACLLGSKRPFAEDVSFFDPAHLQRVRSYQFQQSNHFVYSPRRLSEVKYAAALGGHPKSGQWRSPQNRPMENSQDKGSYSAPEGAPASIFVCERFGDLDELMANWLHLSGGYVHAGKRTERRLRG